jgi:phage antirepressor YoqD-like protein
MIEKALADPEYIIKLFVLLKDIKLENAQSKRIISELKPKATYYDLVLQNKNTMAITKIAKDYGMSGQAFNSMLHELGVQFKMGDCWLLYQKHADKGLRSRKLS